MSVAPDDPEKKEYPMPMNASGQFDIEVCARALPHTHFYRPTLPSAFLFSPSHLASSPPSCRTRALSVAPKTFQVGRIRGNDVFGDNGLDLFVSGDQLLRYACVCGGWVGYTMGLCTKLNTSSSLLPVPTHPGHPSEGRRSTPSSSPK